MTEDLAGEYTFAARFNAARGNQQGLAVRDAEPATSTHQQLAGHLAPRCHDLILAEAGLHQVGDKQLEAVGWTRVAGLTEVGREYCRSVRIATASLHGSAPPAKDAVGSMRGRT